MRPTLKLIGINIVVFIALAALSEVGLRLFGYKSLFQTEKSRREWKAQYKKICIKSLSRELKVHDSYMTGSDGIFRANPEFRFSEIKKVKINPQGFRGNPFEYVDTPKTKILLLGDSFTWGGTASPITESFADRIQSAGYYLYNSGIAGTDPVQYRMIAEKYVPLLRPEVVAAFLYLGNDVTRFPHPIEPNKPIYYVTNFGWLLGYDERGNYFKNGREAFLYLKKRICGQCANPWEFFLYRTALGKLIYDCFKGKNRLKVDRERQWVRDSLTRIGEISRAHGTRFFLFLIPVRKSIERPWNSLKNLRRYLRGFTYYYPEDMEESDFRPPPNHHYNNRGHKKFAALVLRVLKESGISPLKESGIR